ncbi:MAG: hypothetical protein Q8Q08_01095 [Candidatus Omnitrophota bacterium]|nr:hypothetical protein [Candidatus Omnitrophota bacterium]MDZ4241270.1 hypothetical protein [Candidatus Omnitrophota bacterium]
MKHCVPVISFAVVLATLVAGRAFGQSLVDMKRLNDDRAKDMLYALSTAAETYATVNGGAYPANADALTSPDGQLPYLHVTPCGRTESGYKFDCRFTPQGYTITASPVSPGATGSAVYAIETGGILTPREKFSPDLGQPGMPAEWKACETDDDCAGVLVCCYRWETVSKRYAKEAGVSTACRNCVYPEDNQPVPACVKNSCVGTEQRTSVSPQEWIKKNVGVTQASAPVREETWEGYLCRVPGGGVGVGWPVIAMGVEMRDGQQLDAETGKALAPLLSDTPCGYFFWNYSWFGTESNKIKLPDTDVKAVPKVLVKLRGPTQKIVTGQRSFGMDDFKIDIGYDLMSGGRLITVEYLDADWLLNWQDMIKAGFDPWWTQAFQDQPLDKPTAEQRVNAAVPILLEMKRLSAVTPEKIASARVVAPDARVVRTFQAAIEGVALRKLSALVQAHGLDAAALKPLGEVPPDEKTVMDMFTASAGKEDFLEKVRGVWGGALDDLVLYYYVGLGNGATVLQTETLGEIAGQWSDADFQAYLQTSRKILGK